MPGSRVLLVFALIFCLASCGGKKKDKKEVHAATPTEIAVMAYEHLMHGEYDDYVRCVQAYDSIPPSYRESILNVLRQASSKTEKERKGIASVSGKDEITNDKGTFSLVRLDITFGDSTKEEIAVPVVKYNGKWRLQ